MNKKITIAFVVFALLIIGGIIIAIVEVVRKKQKSESFMPILSISCADCINKCNDKYKTDPQLWTQCALDSINNIDCKCPDIKTILATKL